MFPIGLQALSWSLSLGLLVSFFALLAAFLRRKDRAKAVKMPKVHITLYDCLLCGVALLVATAAVWFAIIRPLELPSSFTQLWLLPVSNHACAVSVGVQSFEAMPVSYRIVTSVNHAEVHTWTSIDLTPQGKWSQSLVVNPAEGKSIYIEAQLYRVATPDVVYRNVHLTFHVVTGSKRGQIQQQCSLGT
jgi:hypothetical protein